MDDTIEIQAQKVNTILVVEANAQIGAFFVDAIKMETRYQVMLAADEMQAFAMVKKLVPDLFILDCQLPGINGLELADRFHATEALKHVPILLLDWDLMSPNIFKQEIEKRKMAFIRMPFELKEFLESIENVFAA